MKKNFTLGVICLLCIFLPAVLSAQPEFRFNNNTRVSGTSLSKGAVYRFTNVAAGLDALVTIDDISSGISLSNIDRTADGYPDAFQPEYRISGNTTGYIDFTIQFISQSDDTPVPQATVPATGLDIDGNFNGTNPSGALLKEFNVIDMGNGVADYNTANSELMISHSGTGFRGANATGILYGALVDTAGKPVMFTVTGSNVSTLKYRIGADNQLSGTSPRYASLYFKNFTYQHFPLAASGVLNFQATAAAGSVKLNWELQAAQYKNVIIEKSENGNTFQPVADVNTNGNQTAYSYTDYSGRSAAVYYRLKALTETGKTEYSRQLLVRQNHLQTQPMKIFPNVVESAATISIHSEEAVDAVVAVTDLSGKLVKKMNIQLNGGQNNFVMDGLDRLSDGMYAVSIRGNGIQQTQQIMVR